MQVARDYDWRVTSGYEGSPTISFATDPIGALDLFRLRDIVDGKRRRDALIHWVSEHWRKKRDDPSALVEVRAHLRGQRKFRWGDLNCEVVPSPFDERKAKGAKNQRA